MTITVYGKARNCIQCDRTKVALDKKGIPYVFVDVTVDAEAMAHVLALGYQQVPVVETTHETFSGYRPDKLAGLTNYAKENA